MRTTFLNISYIALSPFFQLRLLRSILFDILIDLNLHLFPKFRAVSEAHVHGFHHDKERSYNKGLENVIQKGWAPFLIYLMCENLSRKAENKAPYTYTPCNAWLIRFHDGARSKISAKHKQSRYYTSIPWKLSDNIISTIS